MSETAIQALRSLVLFGGVLSLSFAIFMQMISHKRFRLGLVMSHFAIGVIFFSLGSMFREGVESVATDPEVYFFVFWILLAVNTVLALMMGVFYAWSDVRPEVVLEEGKSD